MIKQIKIREFSIIDIALFCQALQVHAGKHFLSDKVLACLQVSLSPALTRAIVEFPYVDKDFRDTYYHDFSKRFQEISRDSLRVHLFEGREYRGFFTLHEVAPFNIGRSYLSPYALKDASAGYYVLAEYKVNCCGEVYRIKAFPWMQQDVNVVRCAHVALWEVIRYFSQCKPEYPEMTLAQIANSANSTSRKIPSNGLTVQQMSQVLTDSGFSVDLYSKATMKRVLKDQYQTNDLPALLFSYIESGIPVIAVYDSKPHAVSIIGHAQPDFTRKFSDRIVPNYYYHRGLISCDDNRMAYSMLSQEELHDIEFILAPLHSRMYVGLYTFQKELLPEFEEQIIKPKIGAAQYVRRVFITSSNSLKSFILANSSDPRYRDLTVRLLMPQFVIVVEYAQKDDYPDKIEFRAIFDSTALQKVDMDAILISLKAKDALFVAGARDVFALECDSEPLYKNNLEEICL